MDDLSKKHEGWSDEQYAAEYGDKWEYMKSQDVFSRLPKAQQEAIRKNEIALWEAQQNGLNKIKAYAEMEEVQKRFSNLLGDRDGRAYVESVVIAVASKPDLQQCSARSIMIQAMRAASLKLSLDPALHQAHLVRYGQEAVLIPDYHGLLQLTEATGYYKIAPNVSEVYEGECVTINRFTGRVDVTGEKKSDTVIGWCGYFMGKDETERWLYMTNEECDEHGKKYNPRGYESKNSAWNTDRDKMRRKTVLRQLILRWGKFSPHVQRIVSREEPAIDAECKADYDMPDEKDIIITKRPTDHIMKELGFEKEDK